MSDSFTEWMENLAQVAKDEFDFEHDDFDPESWRDYFDEGYSPREALFEDLSNA